MEPRIVCVCNEKLHLQDLVRIQIVSRILGVCLTVVCESTFFKDLEDLFVELLP